jgi:hypothetical protein
MKWFKRIAFSALLIGLVFVSSGYINKFLNKTPDIPYEKIKDELLKSAVPVVIITTEQEIADEPKVKASLTLLKKDSVLLKHKIGIEMRGKTSQLYSLKKSFAFEFRDNKGEAEEVSVLGMPKDEEWNLIANVVNHWGGDSWDKSMLFNYVGYTISRKTGHYASRLDYVELVLNGQYMGLYTLGEKLKKAKYRIAIESNDSLETTDNQSFIIAIDKANPLEKEKLKTAKSWDMSNHFHYTPASSFRSDYGVDRKKLGFEPFNKENKPKEIYFNYEYPKAKNINSTQKEYIKNYINAFETALLTVDFAKEKRNYENYIEVESFIDYFLVNELCKNIDAYRLSTFLHKTKEGKLKMGPVWDMNIGFNEGGRIPDNDWVINYQKYVQDDNWSMPFWWTRLMEDPIYVQKTKERWRQLRKTSLNNEVLLDIVNSKNNELSVNGAWERNARKWDKKGKINHTKAVNELQKFLVHRANWMDETL